MRARSVHVRRDAGVEMIIAIDSTLRGPALGGCRWRPYPDAEQASADAQALARAMTRKAAMARLALGGGKAVVIGDPRERTDDQLRAFGAFVDTLAGFYITAADMGTGEHEMAVIAEATTFVEGLPETHGGAGDPGPFTALGVLLAMERACQHLDRSLAGATVAVQGVGSVGASLVRHLLEAGARVIAADLDDAAFAALPAEVERVAPDEILRRDCDVLAPCGPGGVIDAATAGEISCALVCGAANNPLQDPAAARVLSQRGILYVPDFVANAGGLIHLAVARDGGEGAASRRQLGVIAENVDEILARAKAEQIDPATAAERIALSRIPWG